MSTTTAKPRVAFASFNNPAFEQLHGGTGRPVAASVPASAAGPGPAAAGPNTAGPSSSSPNGDTRGASALDIQPLTTAAEVAEEDRDLERLIYPDTEATFKRLTRLFWIVQLLIIVHVFVVSYTDPTPTESNNLLIQILIVSIQVGFIVIIMMAFFVFTSQTIFVRFGRYDKYLKEYGLFYGVALVQLLMIAAVKAYYIVLYIQWTSPPSYFSMTAYYAAWVVQRCVLLAFWVTTTYASVRVFRERVYDPEYLLNS